MQQPSGNIMFQVYRGEETPFLFEQGLQVYFGLTGCASVICTREAYVLEKAGVLVINPFELAQVRVPADAALICMRLAPSLLRIAGWDEKTWYDCYSRSGADAQESYETLRVLMASAFQAFFEGEQASRGSCAAYALQLMQSLQAGFKKKPLAQSLQARSSRTMGRLSRILNYIDMHWNEPLTLSGIAKAEYLSLSYLSRFFQKHMGISFTAYLSDVRIRQAARMLLSSHESVTNISYQCGFYNVSTFIDAFRRKFGETPGQYRKHHAISNAAPGAMQVQFDSEHAVQTLVQYAPAPKTEKPPEVSTLLQFDCAARGEPLEQSWRKLLNIGYARDGLLASVQAQIHQAQADIGFTYLRFHGIFDADMYIYDELPDGTPKLSFLYLDMLLDFVLQEGLKPYIEFGFMPRQLAREERRIFDRSSVISGCNNLASWRALVLGTLQHVLARYGLECVRTWRFTMICHSYVSLGCISKTDYEALFLETYHAIKNTDSQIRFGGPGCFAETIAGDDGLRGFLRFAEHNDCIPDFISVQMYPYQHATDDDLFMQFTISQQSAPSILSEDVDFMANQLMQLQTTIETTLHTSREIIVEECNSTLWQRDLSSDTCYKAVWMAKNFCENHSRVHAIGYWLLTDFIEERASKEAVFHGGYGLFTTTGIPKAGYRALELLHRLGTSVIAGGEGWLATREGNSVTILLYNYCHYRNLYRYRYQRLSEPSQAYDVFETGVTKHFQILLTGLQETHYAVKRQRITRQNGSAFDAWIALGAPPMPDADCTTYLKTMTNPSQTAMHLSAYEGLRIECDLQPLEMELITLVPEVKHTAFQHDS